MLTYYCILLCKSVSGPGLIIKKWQEIDGARSISK